MSATRTIGRLWKWYIDALTMVVYSFYILLDLTSQEPRWTHGLIVIYSPMECYRQSSNWAKLSKDYSLWKTGIASVLIMIKHSWLGIVNLKIVGISWNQTMMSISIECGVIICYPARAHSAPERISFGKSSCLKMVFPEDTSHFYNKGILKQNIEFAFQGEIDPLPSLKYFWI